MMDEFWYFVATGSIRGIIYYIYLPESPENDYEILIELFWTQILKLQIRTTVELKCRSFQYSCNA